VDGKILLNLHSSNFGFVFEPNYYFDFSYHDAIMYMLFNAYYREMSVYSNRQRELRG